MPKAFRVLVLISLLALSAVACDASESPPAGGNLDAEAVLQQASDDLAEETIEGTFEISGDAEGRRFAMSGDLQMDPKAELAHMTFVFDQVPGLDDGAEMEMVIDGTTVYMRGVMLGPDDGWVKIDGEAAGMDNAFDGSGQMDPSAFLDFLRGADGIEVVGTEDVRGHETTHYSGTINPAELIAAAPSNEEQEEAEKALEGLEQHLGELEMTFDAWVDASGIPWRFSIGFAPDDVEASFGFTVEILEIGGDVEIEVPSGKDVTDLGNLGLPAEAV
jgi:hypothetical protein